MSNPNKFYYKAFGLNLESDYVLNGLLPADGPTQVRIREGIVNAQFPGQVGENTYWSGDKDNFAFRVIGFGDFQIINGNEIIIQSDPEITDDNRENFILGTCAGVLLVQRDLIPMHGSTLSLNNKEVIFSGHSGAGKSTLTASLINRGYSFLADDISALKVNDNGEAWIMPAFPKQKLCGDAATNIYGSVDGLARVPGVRDKYHVPSTEQFVDESRQLKALFELSIHSGSNVEIEELKGAEKIAVIIRNTYRFQIFEVNQIEAQHFQQCAKIASKIKVYKLRRPETGFSVDEQINNIMRVLEHV